MPLAFISALLTGDKGRKYSFALVKSASSMLLYVLFVMIIGNGFYIFAPGFMGSIGYNLFMSLLSIVFGGAVFSLTVKYDVFKVFCNEAKLIRICALIETALLTFISIVWPIALILDNNEFNRISFYLLYSATIVFIFFLLYCFAVAENKLKHHNERMKFDEINNLIIEEKYKDIVRLKHYYNKLYSMMNGYIVNQNWRELTTYFEKYISPLHKSRIESDDIPPKLDLIENTLIQNLLFDTVVKATHVYNIKTSIDITCVINDFFMNEMDLFIVLNEWISNAFQATKHEGSIYLLISGSDSAITIKLVNPIYEDIVIHAIRQYGYTTKPGHDGAGLPETEKILSSYENVEHMTYLELATFVQCLIIRKS